MAALNVIAWTMIILEVVVNGLGVICKEAISDRVASLIATLLYTATLIAYINK